MRRTIALLAAAGLIMAGLVASGVPAGARGASPAANGKIAFCRDSPARWRVPLLPMAAPPS